MKKIELNITLEDFNYRPVTDEEERMLYENTSGCPLANAVRKAGICKNPCVGTDSVGDGDANGDITIGYIKPYFGIIDFRNLLTGKTKSFKTTFTYNA